MQREREAFHVGALTNMAAGEHVLIFVIHNVLVPVTYLLLNTMAQVPNIE